MPDTTQRDVVVALDPEDLRACLHRQIRSAHRRKQLRHPELPFGVVAIDGKCTATPFVDCMFAQRQPLTGRAGRPSGMQGLTRTLTSCLVRVTCSVSATSAGT